MVRKKHPKLTEENKQYILEHYHEMGYKSMSKFLGVSRQGTRKFYVENGLKCDHDGRFKKGQIPWSKGKTMEEICKTPEALEKSKSTRFGCGHTPYNYDPVGTVKVKDDGYFWTKIAEPNKWRQTHRIIFEEATGQILSDEDLVFFLDGDRTNLNPDNLKMCNRSELAIMNTRGLRSSDPDITTCGLAVARLRNTIRRRGNES